MLIEQGAADATVLPSFTDLLADDYKKRGIKVTYKKYDGVSHGAIVDVAAKHATSQARKWLKR